MTKGVAPLGDVRHVSGVVAGRTNNLPNSLTSFVGRDVDVAEESGP